MHTADPDGSSGSDNAHTILMVAPDAGVVDSLVRQATNRRLSLQVIIIRCFPAMVKESPLRPTLSLLPLPDGAHVQCAGALNLALLGILPRFQTPGGKSSVTSLA